METWLIVLIVVSLILLIVWSVYVSDNHRTRDYEMPYQPINTTPIEVIPVVQIDSQSFTNWKKAKKQEILSKPTVYDIIFDKIVNEIRYVDLINSREWHLKRLEVLIRDHFVCQDCSEKNQKHLQVHHNYYLAERFPWDIDNSALVTLCRNHHLERHNGKVMKVYKKVNDKLIETTSQNIYCARCLGMGYLPQFSHVQAGICFLCNGDCVTKSIFSNQLRWVTYSSLSSEIDTVLNKISQEYYDTHLKIEGEQNFPPPVNPTENEPPFDNLPF